MPEFRCGRNFVYRKFVPGQTLFGKRRACQRKVVYAKFEGICSGDILTFEPKNRKVLLPELLPVICQSDAFFDHALDSSAGSLSPRTSWTALKDVEFLLPPLDEPKRIAEMLWAANEAFNLHQQSADLVGKVGIFDLEGNYVFASYPVHLSADEDHILPDFLDQYLNGDLCQRRLLAYASPGVSQTNISAGNLKKVLVPLPPMERQIVKVGRQTLALRDSVEIPSGAGPVPAAVEDAILRRMQVSRSPIALSRCLRSSFARSQCTTRLSVGKNAPGALALSNTMTMGAEAMAGTRPDLPNRAARSPGSEGLG